MYFIHAITSSTLPCPMDLSFPRLLGPAKFKILPCTGTSRRTRARCDRETFQFPRRCSFAASASRVTVPALLTASRFLPTFCCLMNRLCGFREHQSPGHNFCFCLVAMTEQDPRCYLFKSRTDGPHLFL